MAFAIRLAHDAGRLALDFFNAPRLDTKLKHPGDLVTAADLAVDRLIADRLSTAFPEDGRLSEESDGRTAPGIWVVDPIDGTGNFARRIPHFAISIAYTFEGRTELGIVFNPASGELFSARRGHGAYCGERRMNVSDSTRKTTVVEVGHASRNPTPAYLQMLGAILDRGHGFCQLGSAALGLAYVADGRIDGYCELSLYAWDVLAGKLLVEEAGGWCSLVPVGTTPAGTLEILAAASDLAPSLREITGMADTAT